jgi:hypothetical protein
MDARLRAHADAASSACWWWPHRDFVMVCERPTTIARDEAGRLHSATGKAIEWPDGWGLYRHHGMAVPADIIEHPERITRARILDERNAEIRRVMVEIYGVARYVQDSGAEVVHADKDSLGHPRRLLRAPAPGDDPIVLIELTNSTPEPDGSHRMFHIRVHPELRPIPFEPGQEFGEPQEMTCINAVASLYGLRGEGYRPGVET